METAGIHGGPKGNGEPGSGEPLKCPTRHTARKCSRLRLQVVILVCPPLQQTQPSKHDGKHLSLNLNSPFVHSKPHTAQSRPVSPLGPAGLQEKLVALTGHGACADAVACLHRGGRCQSPPAEALWPPDKANVASAPVRHVLAPSLYQARYQAKRRPGS
jgi:hypothetical protein